MAVKKKLQIGDPLDTKVTKQIEVRQNTFGTPDKSARQLEAIHQATPWIVMRSSVNVLTEEQTNKLKTKPEKRSQIIGSSKLAESYQLSGGVIKGRNGSASFGVNAKPDDNFTTPAYSRDDSFGTVPMPGITSMEVKARGEFGATKEAVVKLEVHSLEDLNEIERVYFRIGYSALIEFGHSVYIDNDGNVVHAHRATHTVPDEEWFTSESTKLAKDKKIAKKRETTPIPFTIPGEGRMDIHELIADLQDKTDYNYDGVYGFIRNFEWRYDAASQKYEATITIIAKGVLYEGIKMGAVSDNIPESEIIAKGTENSGEQYKTVFHYLIFKLDEGRKKDQDKYDSYGQASTKKLLEAAGANTYAQKLTDYQFFYMQKPGKEDKLNYMGYIPLGLVFDVANNFNTIFAGKESKKPLVQFELEGDTFNTHDNHFSLDPGIAVPPQVAKDGLLRPLSVFFQGHIDKTDSSNVPYLHLDMQDWASKNGGTDQIGNIMVNTSYILDVFDDVLTNDKGLLEGISNLLGGIEQALGGINSLTMFYDESINEWICRDIQAVEASNELFEMEVTGLKSTVESLDVGSSITPDLGSMIAISASGTKAVSPQQMQTMLRWNYGLVDRHMPFKDSTPNEASTSIKTSRQKTSDYAKNVEGEWKKFNSVYKNSSKRYSRDDWKTLRIEGLQRLKHITYIEEIKKDRITQGLIPVSLNMTVLGISGLVITQRFKVKKGLLPTKYDEVAYMLLGTTHTVDVEGWKTNITTQMQVKNPIGDLSEEDKEEILAQEEETRLISDEEAAKAIIEKDIESPNADGLRNVLDELGYLEKQMYKGFFGLGGKYGELTSSGKDITAALSREADTMFRELKKKFPGTKLQVTAGNDAYHKELSYTSPHSSGKGLDFVIKIKPKPQVEQEMGDFLTAKYQNSSTVKFRNEYLQPSPEAKGKHFHIELI